MRVVHVLRKPLTGSVAETVLAHGCGAMNIDAGRIHSGPSAGGTTSGENAFGQDAGWNKTNVYTQGIDRSMSAGRWPANLVLQHPSGCRPTGTKQVTSQNPAYANEYNNPIYGTLSGPREQGKGIGFGDADGKEIILVWECQPGCPVPDLDEQSIASRLNPKDERGLYAGSRFFKQVGGDK